jgi:hypothetical protein
MAKKKQIFIFGSYGNLTCDDDGKIISTEFDYEDGNEKESGEHEYSKILRFDVAEFTKEYGSLGDRNIDILDIGYWFSDGDGQEQYEPPDYEFRDGFRKPYPKFYADKK